MTRQEVGFLDFTHWDNNSHRTRQEVGCTIWNQNSFPGKILDVNASVVVLTETTIILSEPDNWLMIHCVHNLVKNYSPTTRRSVDDSLCIQLATKILLPGSNHWLMIHLHNLGQKFISQELTRDWWLVVYTNWYYNFPPRTRRAVDNSICAQIGTTILFTGTNERLMVHSIHHL